MSSSLIVIGIILITLGMMAYPLLQFMPTDREKHQQQLRQEALKQGLQVQIRSPDIDDGLKETYASLKNTVAYFLPKETHLPGTYCAVRSINHTGRWFWTHNKQPDGKILEQLQSILAELPDDFKAIEIGRAGVAVFWCESNDNLSIKRIKEWLSLLLKN